MHNEYIFLYGASVASGLVMFILIAATVAMVCHTRGAVTQRGKTTERYRDDGAGGEAYRHFIGRDDLAFRLVGTVITAIGVIFAFCATLAFWLEATAR